MAKKCELIPIYRAHTDGDTMVRFRNDDIIMTGDFFRSIGYPNIDRANGGSLNGMLDGLGELIGMMGPKTKAIPGHGPNVGRAEITAHRDMILAVRDRVAAMIAQGKSQAEVLAANPTADYDAKIPTAADTKQRFVTQVYAELSLRQISFLPEARPKSLLNGRALPTMSPAQCPLDQASDDAAEAFPGMAYNGKSG